MKVAVIGGGAAGYFAAISAKAHHSDSEVVIFEKTNKVLSKVKVSGGGRCNVTHACFDVKDLLQFYPRGGKLLKKALYEFNPNHTVAWFEGRGVPLKTEADNRMFPITDSSQTIIDCLEQEVRKLGIRVSLSSAISAIRPLDHRFELAVNKEIIQVDKVIVTTGGSNKIEGYKWLQSLGHAIVPPAPSLFTFNMPSEEIRTLMGVVAPHARVRVLGSKLEATGPLLITHWGMSGPAVLKLSAFGAKWLAEKQYAFSVLVSWLGNTKEDECRVIFQEVISSSGNTMVSNWRNEWVPKRLWLFLLTKLEIDPSTKWNELGKKNSNRLINLLINDEYRVSGKTTFKEEFVTCGGVDLSQVDPLTMESKVVPGLYFAGEVLDIDGVTGGFNFQAAWTTGFLAGKHVGTHARN
ncbi:MAG: NAD(P)/FAD-dependent oxidoreductase [Flavobacteriales bacterium]|nr:NAD(P)/FAD-dependent oxidoreductase [Flavobacteriales bacterium]